MVSAVQSGASLVVPLAIVGIAFVLLQVLTPIHQAISANLGDRTAAWLYDRLTDACVQPPGMAHLEDPKLTGDLSMARDFDLGMTGRLTIEGPKGRGEIQFAEGAIANAAFGALGGEDAFYELLSVQEGDFALDPGFVPPKKVIKGSAEMLLLEGLRRLDERNR